MDKYVLVKCLNGTGTYFYYKNGKLHREAGPAIVESEDKRKFTKLIDENLYQIKIIKNKITPEYQELIEKHRDKSTFWEFVMQTYYLEGQPYSKEEFEIRKARINLNKELNNSLLSKEDNQIKKTKI